MGEVAAVAKVQADEFVAGFEAGHEHGHIGLCARVGLHVGVFGAKKAFHAFAGESLPGPLPGIRRSSVGGIAFGIFVCETRAHGAHHLVAHIVFGSDEFNAVFLAPVFGGDEVENCCVVLHIIIGLVGFIFCVWFRLQPRNRSAEGAPGSSILRGCSSSVRLCKVEACRCRRPCSISACQGACYGPETYGGCRGRALFLPGIPATAGIPPPPGIPTAIPGYAGQARGLPFVGVPPDTTPQRSVARAMAAVVRFDGEFAAFGDKAVGEASGPHGDVQHGRVGHTYPVHATVIRIVAPVWAAAHKNGSERVEECAGFPVQLHCSYSGLYATDGAVQ